MRVYKFRAICNDAGYGNEEYYLKMIYSYSINQIAFGDEVDEVRLLVDGKWLKVKIETVGLYTGINDKNGNEIYKGDIVRFDEELSVVRYDEETARFVLDDYGIFGCLMEYGWDEGAGGIGVVNTNGFDDFNDISEIEVIGNIYENPELLEGSQYSNNRETLCIS